MAKVLEVGERAANKVLHYMEMHCVASTLGGLITMYFNNGKLKLLLLFSFFPFFFRFSRRYILKRL
ncbi:hypothetical protein CXB51_006620 [Gossypium anomalum]|uniref:Uncharacterized protein n=1 Tax=Gossypium anomalum TaxID=47600 RepID=A0A8J5YZT0_9ROSI|nr:hypothetical protein CXB51_006620 [Gossypium anomalum]